MSSELANSLNERFKASTPETILAYFLSTYKNKIILSSSMGCEDQVLLDMMNKIDASTPVFTIDTGRLFPETYELIDASGTRYNKKIMVYFPNHNEVQSMVYNHGVNLFYTSPEKRKMCCNLRKLGPLNQALSGFDVWICGLRKDQSISRFYSQAVEWDEQHQMLKINPLIRWTEQQVWQYIKDNQVPYNSLHDKEYPSIGCQPCTRAIKSGENIRAGRWWWEQSEQKECGLHKPSHE